MTTEQTAINSRGRKAARDWRRRQIFAAHPEAPDPSLVQDKGLPVTVWKLIRIDEGSGCWLWTGSLNREGYGRTRHGAGVYNRVHRLVYEVLIGPIPDGLVIDHLCRVRHCCNPAHLEPVTQRENVLRGLSHIAAIAVATSCKSGHEYTLENTRINRLGHRVCRACERKWRKR